MILKQLGLYCCSFPAVRTASSVRVDNVPADVIANKKLLKLYFEKWGGPVEKISTNPEAKAIIITFCSEDGMKQTSFSPRFSVTL